MRVLRVGDPHVRMNNLKDSESLMQAVAELAVSEKVDRIEILGDLFHNHAVVRVEILTFWNDWLDRLSVICETVVLVGNHDQTGDYDSDMNALSVFKHIPNPNLHIIDKPTILAGPFGYVPYIHHESDFVSAANGLSDAGAKTLVCHATFNGAKYDNGMYAPDGFELEKLNFPLIISGHIHARQTFGTLSKLVRYPGTAKWDSFSDANEDKGLWLVDHDDATGAILTEKYISTKEICTPIFSLEWKEGQEQPEIPEGRVTVELFGTSEWVKKQREKLKGKCSVKSRITDRVRRRERSAGPIDLASFVNGTFEPVAGVTRQAIYDWMKENELV